MKKGLLITTMIAGSALLLASCAKSVSFEEAKKHCDDNFTSTEIKTFAVHTKVDVKKAEGALAPFFSVGVTEDDDEILAGVVTSADVALLGNTFSYSVDGTKLITELTLSVKQFIGQYGIALPDNAEVSGSSYNKTETDAAGYPALEYEKTDLSFSYSAPGISLSGALTCETTVTFTAK